MYLHFSLLRVEASQRLSERLVVLCRERSSNAKPTIQQLYTDPLLITEVSVFQLRWEQVNLCTCTWASSRRALAGLSWLSCLPALCAITDRSTQSVWSDFSTLCAENNHGTWDTACHFQSRGITTYLFSLIYLRCALISAVSFLIGDSLLHSISKVSEKDKFRIFNQNQFINTINEEQTLCQTRNM